MATIQSLSVKTLVKVLAELRGGSIGFDAYRDDRTNSKAKLLAFILANHDNSAIIAAIEKVGGETISAPQAVTPVLPTDAYPAPEHNLVTVTLHYKTPSGDKECRDFVGSTEAVARKIATDWLSKHPHLLSVQPGIVLKQALSATPAQAPLSFTMPKAKAAVSDATAPLPEAAQLAQILASMASKGAVDETKVREICDARAQEYVDNILSAINGRLAGYDDKIATLQMPVTVHVLKAGETKPVDIGTQHKSFPTLLKMAQAKTRDGNRLNIWLKGPAGSGKTTAAKKVAEALSMPFQFNGAISTEYELMGFRDAGGTYHTTAFREVFENGGVYLFDEVDSSLPKAVLAFNAALANGECRFPDKMVMRHPDCVIIAGANTAGNGASSDYVGRMKQDLAFLNRFVMLDWELDEALEKALASNKDWVRKVQVFRKNAIKRNIRGHIISPRATFYGEALLAVGVDMEIVEQATLRGALSKDQWEQLCQ